MPLLVLAIVAVGILHTAVPDHWAPIAVLARQKGWSGWWTARVAAGAGIGHTVSTLALGAVFWAAGRALALRYAALVNTVGALALIAVGLWIAFGAGRELRGSRGHLGHFHTHRHSGGVSHAHWHTHETPAEVEQTDAVHEHAHPTSSGMAFMLVAGSSPSIEALPVFFAGAPYGIGFVLLLAALFGVCTTGTYVGLSLASAAGLERLNLGPIEKYGEVASGAFVALIGAAFLLSALLRP